LRIAYLVNQYPRTSHSFIRREIQALEAQGLEVQRYSLRSPNEKLVSEADRQELTRTRAVLDAGVVAHVLSVARVGLCRPGSFARAVAATFRLGRRSDRGLLRHFAYLAEACVLARWLRRGGADHVHAHFGTNSTAVALLCREVGGPPYSVTVHGPEEFDRPEALKLGEKVRRAVFAVAISSFGRAQLCRWIRFEDWAKVHVVRCGLDAELLAVHVPPLPSSPRLVCVARLSKEKGHLLLLEAAARLMGEGLAFELVLVGDGPLRGTIEDRIRSDGLEGCVRLTGALGGPQVLQEIAASRAMVLASFAEGLPIVVMEALALGRPVITTAIAGIPELVESGVSGWLVPAGSVEALAGAMRAALEAPAARLAAMGRAGAAEVARRHDARAEAQKLAGLFRASVELSAATYPLGETPPGATARRYSSSS
jgi:glycosyltransferase involved in cell wall biosynthesis